MSEENVPLNMTYQVSCTGSGSASISGNTLNIVAGNTSGTMTVTIQPMIDGIRVGKAKVITIEVKGSASANNGATGGVNNGGSTGGVNTNDISTSQVLQNNMSGFIDSSYSETGAYRDRIDKGIDNYDGHASLESAKGTVETKIETFVDNLETGLRAEGYDPTRLETANKKTVAFFSRLIRDLEDKSNNKEDEMVSNTTNYGNVTYYSYIYDYYDTAYGYADADNQNVRVIVAEDGEDEFAIQITKAFIIQKFIEYYNAA